MLLPIETFGNVEVLNNKLRLLLRRTEDLVLLAKKYEADCIVTLKDFLSSSRSVAEVEALLKKKQDNVNAIYTNLDFFFQVDEYIRSQTTKVSEHMPAIYRNMKMHLQEFEKFRKAPITFDGLNYTFYEDFVEYLSYHYEHKRRITKIMGLKKNTVGKTIKQLRIFLHNRARKRIITEIDLSGWTVFNEDADAIYLTWEEIGKMYTVNLTSHPYLKPYRQDFVLGCLTGLRFSDFSGIEKTDLTLNTLRIKQQKSNGWVVIPLREEAKEILTQRFKNNLATLTNAEFNRHIKIIAQLAGITTLVKHSHKKGNKKVVEVKPKYAWVTSHTCRRSFCTNEFLAGTPVELIMKISGHKSVKDFYRYIRITPEEAARILEDIWKERGEMNVLGSKLRKVS